MLLEDAHLDVWRAPTDNERHMKTKWGLFEDNMSGWNMNRLFDKCYEMTCEKTAEGYVVTAKGSLAGIARTPLLHYKNIYVVKPDGTLTVSVHADVNEKAVWLPRFGMEFKVPYEMEQIEYYGMGPYENYQDMHHHAKVGRYVSTVDDEYVAYIKPQDCGNHTKVKELTVQNKENGTGLHFRTDGEIEFQVSHYTKEEMTEKLHNHELVKSDTMIRIDYKTSGIGSASCG